MLPFRRFQSAVLCAVLATAGIGRAQEIIDPVPEPPLPPLHLPGGLTLSLSTSGYKFTPILGSLIHPGTGATDLAGRRGPVEGFPPIRPQGFVASVALINHTGDPIQFVFPTPVDAQKHFVFRVYDATGNPVWESNAGATAPPIITDVKLDGHQAWRATRFIPLFINGAPLAAGTYTLTATVNGSPLFESTTTFVVEPAVGIATGVSPLIKKEVK